MLGTPAYKDKAQSNTKATKFHPHPAEAPNSKRIAVQKTESLNREGGEHPPSCLHIAVGADEPPIRSQRRPHTFSPRCSGRGQPTMAAPFKAPGAQCGACSMEPPSPSSPPTSYLYLLL